MIAIVNYDPEQSERIVRFLNEIEIPNRILINETEILNAKGIVLPNSHDLKDAIRRIHFKNLFSALRMCKKPILGIGNGMIMMCENTIPDNLNGFGFFDLTAQQLNHESKKEDLLMSIKFPSRMLNLAKDVNVKIEDVDYIVEENDYSSYMVQSNNKLISAFMERGNCFGTIINLIDSDDVGRLLFKKFFDISCS
jgi:imidazoleglycerol phosphate synthase glutamine amidotransferase subunit HisH